MDELVHLHFALDRLVRQIGEVTPSKFEELHLQTQKVLRQEADDLSVALSHLSDLCEAVLPSGNDGASGVNANGDDIPFPALDDPRNLYWEEIPLWTRGDAGVGK